MPITTKSAAKPRTTLLGYLNKRGGAMPTRSEWLTILNSNINIKEDLQLEQDDIEGLTDALDKKLDADKLPNADKMFEALKESINELINEKVSEATKAAAAATIQLADFDNDTKPVGAICQYIGEDNEKNNYFQGFFYKKVREHDAELDNQEPQPETITGEPITIKNTAKYTFGGVTYLGNFQQQDAATSSNKAEAYIVNEKYLVFAVKKEALLEDDGNHFPLASNEYSIFPIAINVNTLQLVTTEYKEADGYSYPVLHVNGELMTRSSNTAAFYNIIFRESDNAPFFMINHDTTKGYFAIVCPVYADRLIDIAAEEEDYFAIATTEPNPMSDITRGANITITPNYPVRGAEPINSLAPWKMIQVSPFCIPD